ncbi:C39 family peptidase [Paenibacillus sp. UMB4589-SE434]|uniref:C39 family peptidase n=1 Tax=Paenibacillus sp. UMB4589-SE434 TaxID=3046314 RepID=UPI0025512F8D|nr:C39 family peptidase [Paenibacillus sp. UMB4589-SE434]MDK8183472.1 C39 family peptidase [Paenibacillus sp. UMB4589-SE434]
MNNRRFKVIVSILGSILLFMSSVLGSSASPSSGQSAISEVHSLPSANIEGSFSGVTAPIGVNVRSAPSLRATIAYTIAGNTSVNFDGWERGDIVKDYWTGIDDDRWFYFFKDQNKYYVASGFINGNPSEPGSSAAVPDIQQLMSNWCWAGVSVAVLEHYGIDVTQQQFVSYVKGGSYNYPATSYEIKQGLQYYSVKSNLFNSIPSLQWVKGQLDKGQPMITFISWTNGSNIGHFLVLDGYNSGVNGTNYVSYMDPWYGDHYSHTFDAFKSNNRFTWEGTISTSK